MIDHVDPMAKRIGAVNTIVVEPDGGLRGFDNNRDARPEPARRAARLATCSDPSSCWEPAVRRAWSRRWHVGRARNSARPTARSRRPSKWPTIRLGPVIAIPWEEREAALEGAALLGQRRELGLAGKPALEDRLDALGVRRWSATSFTRHLKRRCSRRRGHEAMSR